VTSRIAGSEGATVKRQRGPVGAMGVSSGNATSLARHAPYAA